MERHQRIRLFWLVGMWLVVEVLLWLLGRRAPALADLVGLGYWIALIAFAIPVARAIRKRAGTDRRRADRRAEQEAEEELSSKQ